MLYEDPTKESTSDERFHVELHFSPGVNCCVEKDLPPGPGFRPHSRNNEQVGISFWLSEYRMMLYLFQNGSQKNSIGTHSNSVESPESDISEMVSQVLV